MGRIVGHVMPMTAEYVMATLEGLVWPLFKPVSKYLLDVQVLFDERRPDGQCGHNPMDIQTCLH